MRDRFVEADGRLEPVLRTGVPADIVLREWLLDPEQPVGVEIREMLRVRRIWALLASAINGGTAPSASRTAPMYSMAAPGRILILR